MKFSCNRDQLFEAIQSASRALSSRASIHGVRWSVQGGTLTIEGRESDLSIRSQLVVEGDELGRWTTPASLAADLTRSLPQEEVEVVLDESAMYMRSGRSEVSINLLEDFDISAIQSPETDVVEITANEFLHGLNRVATAASRDEARDLVYTGVLFRATASGVRLVATDGVRLAMCDLPGLLSSGTWGEQEVIIPTRSVKELERLLGMLGPDATIKARIGSREAVFEVGSYTLSTRLIEEPFRDFSHLVDITYSKVMLADKESFRQALRRLRILAKEARNSSSVRLSVDGSTCELSVRIPRVGEAHEVLDVTFPDGIFSIFFEPDMLMEGIESIDSDVIRMEFLEHNRPSAITNSDSRDFLYLLMPVVQKT